MKSICDKSCRSCLLFVSAMLWTVQILYTSVRWVQWRTEVVVVAAAEGGFKPPPPLEISKALQSRVKLNPIVKTVKNC